MPNVAPEKGRTAMLPTAAASAARGPGTLRAETRVPTKPSDPLPTREMGAVDLPREIPHLGDAAEATALLHAEAKAAAETQRDLYNMLEFKRERLREATLGLGLARQLEEATAAAEVAAEMERVLCDTLEFTINRLRAVMDETQRLQTRDQES